VNLESYPIDTILPTLKDAVARHRAVILQAPPGAGKTTRVPIALLDVLPREAGRIIMLEPRRLAAVSAARWMAKTLGEAVGETIGYSIRFDTKTSARTRIEVVTEGILTRRMQSDPGLTGVSLVIFDEFHERSIHADLALALCLDVQSGLRQDLKMLVMSATLDSGPLAGLLGGAPVITSTGKAFPVEERYLEDRSGMLAMRVAAAIRTALRQTHGDLLVFLPGAGEIRACERELRASLNLIEDRLSLHPLYGDLPFEDQERAILPSRDFRKIVLATNIAETSLTIEGVQVVIDSGLTRRLSYDPASGMNRLVTIELSRASAEQRKGRAGRLGPGVCYRLYDQFALKGMQAFTLPEILGSDLAPLVLELAVWGVKDPRKLAWLDAPPAAAWNAGLQLLIDLGALDRTGSVTSVGRAMARFPLHPRLSRLLLRSQELGCVNLGIDLAAILSERDLVRKNVAAGIGKEPDVAERVHMLRQWKKKKEPGAGADLSALHAVDRTAKQLQRLLPDIGKTAGQAEVGPDMLSRLLLAAYPDRVAKRRDDGGRVYVLTQGRGIRLSMDSHLVNDPFIVVVQVDAGMKAEGVVHLAAPVTEDLIRSECATRIRSFRRVEWDRNQGRIAAAIEERLDTMLLSSRPFKPSDEETAPILCEAIRTMPGLLTFSKEARQFQARVGLLKKAFPEEEWPDFADHALLSRPEEWLLPWLTNIRTAQGLGGLSLLTALKTRLTWEQGRLLDKRAPLSIPVPSGSQITLDYASGEQPILAVKLQEMFGLADTPLLAEGRVRVLLHLLSPARRPVQITQDLKGFWDSGYPLVKKDLKGRYPKHPWPEDPWNAVPTRRAKPRGQ